MSREEARAQVPGFEARKAALLPYCQPGPDYVRRVRDELEAALHHFEPEFIGGRLVVAEIAAGLRPESDYVTRFEPETWKVSP